MYFLLFRYYLPLEKDRAFHLNKLKSPSLKNMLCQVLLKLAQWFWKRRFHNIVNEFLAIFLLFTLGKGQAPSFEQIWIPFTQDALCQVWLKLAQWFWRRLLNFVNEFLLFPYYSTDRTQPNRKRTQTGPRVRFRGPLEWTQSGPRADAKRTSKANPNFRSKPVKRTRGPVNVTELSIRITDKQSWPIGASTNQKAGCVDQSAHVTIIQCKSVFFFSSTFGLNLCILSNNVLRKKNPKIVTSRDYKISFLL